MDKNFAKLLGEGHVFKLHFAGTDFVIDDLTVHEGGELAPAELEKLKAVGGSGDRGEAVDHFMGHDCEVTGDEKDCRAYRRGYGAWEESELKDHHENLRRLVWLAGCSLSEGESAYFSTY